MAARVTICDDDPVVCDVLQRELGAAGFEMQEPLSGVEQAMGWLSLDAPDVLLLDLNMPAGGGLELLGWMAAKRLLARTRVMVLTAEADGWYIDQARRAGASGYLIKPVAPGTVADKVRRLLDDGSVRWIDDYTALSAPTTPPPGAAGGGLTPILSQMARAYGEPAVRDLLHALLTQLEGFPRTPAPPDQLEHSAHAVRGAASALGFERVAVACFDLERSCRSGGEVTGLRQRAVQACDDAGRDVRSYLRAA